MILNIKKKKCYFLEKWAKNSNRHFSKKKKKTKQTNDHKMDVELLTTANQRKRTLEPWCGTIHAY